VVVVVAVVLILFFFFLLKIVKIASLEPDSESVSATRISLVASSSSFIFFPVISIETPTTVSFLTLLCMTGHSLGT